MLTDFQKTLLNEFWNHYVATNEWPKTRVTHSRHEKARTQQALEILGGSIAVEAEDHSQGNRYSLSLIGALLTENGRRYHELLIKYVEFLRELFYKDPEKHHVTEAEVSEGIGLDKETSTVVGRLLSLRPFYDRGGSPNAWTARIPAFIEDLPRKGPICNSVDTLIFKDFSLAEPVFVSSRRPFDVTVLSLANPLPAPKIVAPAPVDALKRRYQVFVSSTYDDLKVERQHVMQALLETRCIPTGMELFPASSTEQWDLIKRVIEECDYYLIVVGGRYGSPAKDGVGYTEKEFDYALHIGKPVIGFYHRNPNELPGTKLEQTDEARRKLAAFTKKVKSKLCRAWSSPDELGSAVKSAVISELEISPQPGWVRANSLPSFETVDKLKQRIADLEERLKKASRKPQEPDFGNSELEISIRVTYSLPSKPTDATVEEWESDTKSVTYSLRKTWDQLLLQFVDSLQHGVSTDELKRIFEEGVVDEVTPDLIKQSGTSELWGVRCAVDDKFFDRVIHTLASRKLVRIDLPRSRYGLREKRLQLTPTGIARLARLKAL